eukprot:g7272.t1
MIGKVGAGKTTVFNLVCDAQRQAEITDDSCTRTFVSLRVFYDDCAMELLDGPGCSSTEDVYAHSYVTKEGLTAEPLNGIFVTVSYDPRIRNNMGGQFYEAAKMLKPEYYGLIVLLVTKMDQFQGDHNFHTRDEMEDHIRAIFKEDYGIQKAVFCANGSGKGVCGMSKTDQAELFHAMRDAVLGMPAVQLEYSDAEFLEYFDMKAWKGREQFDFHRLKKQVEKLCAGYEEGLRHLLDNRGQFGPAQLQDLLYALIQQSRKELDEDVYDKFCERHGEDQVAFDDYAASIELQKIIHKAHREFRDEVKKHLRVNPDNVADWRNAIRRCQFCEEVWVKVAGCDGETECGARTGGSDGVAGESFFVQMWDWVEGKLRPGSRLMKNRSLEGPVYKSRAAEKPVGCGRTIVWKEQAVVPKAELDQLFSTQELENILSSFKMEARFTSLKKKKERRIPVFSRLDARGREIVEDNDVEMDEEDTVSPGARERRQSESR